MTTRSIATALTLGFLAFIVSVLPVTTAEAECVVYDYSGGPTTCPNGMVRKHLQYINKGEGRVSGYIECCTADGPGLGDVTKDVGEAQKGAAGEAKEPKKLYSTKEREACEAQGNNWDPQTGRCVNVLRSSKQNACEKLGGSWNPATGECKTVKQLVSPPERECEAQGNRYDRLSKQCINVLKKAEPKEQAAEQSSGDDEYTPKKHKKKKRD